MDSIYPAVVVCVALLCSELRGQTVVHEVREEAAISTVQRAISAMGGDSWKAVGAATVTVTISSDRFASFVVNRSDDWSKGRGRYRAQKTISDGVATEINDGLRPPHLYGVGSERTSPSSYDLATLAFYYPAIALSQGLARAECNFRQIPIGTKSPATDALAVSQDCASPFYPNGRMKLTWWFGSNGLPLQVQIPIHSVGPAQVRLRTARFSAFQTLQGLHIPLSVDMQLPGLTEHFAFSAIELQSSLPDSLFSTN